MSATLPEALARAVATLLLILVCALPAGAAAVSHESPEQVERHDWRWFAGYAFLASLLASGVWLLQQRKVRLEAEYSKRLEQAVRQRTHELAQRNDALARANAGLLEASLTDPLTGLRNRRFLFEEVTRHVELIKRWHDDHDDGSSETFNIFFVIVDLDFFKPVNDRCGHAAGDRMLLQVRDVLLRSVRSSDVVVRWGGDEFVVLSRNVKADQIESLAERIRTEIAGEVFRLDEAQVVRTTCSIGYAGYPFVTLTPDAINWEQVLGLADSALYLAKEQRDCWVGYLGNDHADSPDSLFNEIRKDPLTVEDGGGVRICASVPLRVREG